MSEQQRETGRSLGIIRPDDAAQVQFSYKPIDKVSQEERETELGLYRAQQSLLEDPLKPLPPPEYTFRYGFTSGGKEHEMGLHDWEIQTTYQQYKKRYGSPDAALAQMRDYYQHRAPAMNLHFIMGTIAQRPYQFIIIGILRTKADLDAVDAQANLFG